MKPKCPVIKAFEEAKTASAKRTIELIQEYNLTREMINTQYLTDPKVWEALLIKMLPEAMMRNLGNMTKIGLLKQGSAATKHVVKVLSDAEKLQRARIHPLAVLNALKIYSSGHGLRGSGVWTPVTAISDALDDAFYMTFKNITPTNKDFLLACDVSGSMECGTIAGMALTPKEAVAAMVMVTHKVEPNCTVMAFADRFIPYDPSKKTRLDQIVKDMSRMPFGGTDCSLPAKWAEKNKLNFDGIVIYTDNETWMGNTPKSTLGIYRKNVNAQCRQIVVGMTATGFTIADPKDRLSLDVVGFDTATPQLISEFVSGKF